MAQGIYRQNISRPTATAVNAPVTVSQDVSNTPIGETQQTPAINRLLWVTVAVLKTGAGGSPNVNCTLNGVALTQDGSSKLVSAGRHTEVYSFYMLEADLPANGTYDLTASVTTAGSYTVGICSASYANVLQTVPDSASTSTGTDTLSLLLPKPSDAWAFMAAVTAEVSNPGWTHNNSQQFVQFIQNVGSPLYGEAVQVSNPSSISSAFQSTTNITTGAIDQVKVGFEIDPEFDFRKLFSTTVSAQSNVESTLLRLYAAVIAQSVIAGANLEVVNTYLASALSATTTASALLFDRQPPLASAFSATTTGSANFNRDAELLSVLNSAASITAQPFDRAAGLATLVEVIPGISGRFDATRPLTATVNEAVMVEAAFGNNFAETQYSPTPGDYVELFEIDTTVIGGTDVFRFIPHRFETPDAEVLWKGETFIQFPVEADGFEQQATGTAPAQPTLRVSNVNKFILAAVLELGDIVGAKITRWRTYARFLDNGETPDSNAHYAPDIYYVQQKTAQTKQGFEFKLTSALDLPGIRLPRRQILKDQSSDDRNLYAPGVANVRFRGR